MTLTWGLKGLGRRPLRTVLSLAGIAVASALLLDMVMLSGGLERSFEQLLLARGFQIRLTPKGTLPFDTEATIAGVSTIVRRLRDDPTVAAAGSVLGATVYGRRADSLVTLVGYGVEPEAQGIYQLEAGRDLAPQDATGLLLSRPAAHALAAGIGDTVVLVGGLDPQAAAAGRSGRLVVRGIVEWLYDYRGQRSVGATLSVMQRLMGLGREDRASLILVKAVSDSAVQPLTRRIQGAFPDVEVNNVAGLVAHFRERMLYFRQLSYILGTISLVVTVLLVATLLTITVNERLGEIATLRAIGISRRSIVAQVLVEGAALTLAGAVLGIGLGLATARYLDGILTDFPGLPAAFSFFVPRADALAIAAAVLLATGALAGIYPAWLAGRAPIAATLRAEAT